MLPSEFEPADFRKRLAETKSSKRSPAFGKDIIIEALMESYFFLDENILALRPT